MSTGPDRSLNSLNSLHVAALDLVALTTVAVGRISSEALRPGIKLETALGSSPMAAWLTVQPSQDVHAWRDGLFRAFDTRSMPNTLAILEQVHTAVLVDLGRNTARHSVFNQMAGLLDPDTPGTLGDPDTTALHHAASDINAPSPFDARGQTFAAAMGTAHESAVREIQKRLWLAIDTPIEVLRRQFIALAEASTVNIRLATNALVGGSALDVLPKVKHGTAALYGGRDADVWGPVEELIETMKQATLARRFFLANAAASVRDPEVRRAIDAASAQDSSGDRSIDWVDALATEAAEILSPDTGIERLP